MSVNRLLASKGLKLKLWQIFKFKMGVSRHLEFQCLSHYRLPRYRKIWFLHEKYYKKPLSNLNSPSNVLKLEFSPCLTWWLECRINHLDSKLIFGTLAAVTRLFYSMLLPNTRLTFAVLPLPTRLFSKLQMAAPLPRDKIV